jgi:hypothetical protein
MSPTPEVSERQRKAAYKAWETIRRKKAEGGNPETKPDTKARIQARVPVKGPARKKWNLADYPANWTEIVAEIRKRSRNAAGKEQCECMGECLKHRDRCEEINGTWAQHRRRKGKARIRLTIAHLCHTPKCGDRSHLRAMCEPCHLIYDLRCRQQHLSGEDAIKWAIQQRASLGSQRDDSNGTARK